MADEGCIAADPGSINTSERWRIFTTAIPADSSIRNKEHEKTEKYQGLKEQLKQMWKVKFKVVPVLIGGCCGCWAVTHWEGGSSRFQESAVQGIAGFNDTINTVLDPQQELNNEPFFFYVKLLVCITKHDGIPGELAVQ